MNVSRGTVLTGHVAATILGSSAAIAAIIGMAFALGMAAKTPESAGLAVVPLLLLPFLSSAIVPTAKMGQGFRQFAQYQPFTPIIESVRGLLAGTPSGGYAAAALAWCAGIALAGYLWSRATSASKRSLGQLRPARLRPLLRRLFDAGHIHLWYRARKRPGRAT